VVPLLPVRFRVRVSWVALSEGNGGLAIMITKIICDFRPVTLRHQVSLVLPFGSRSILTTLNALVLDAGLCVAVFWRLCFYR
jgi:hypothetical protein